MKIFSSFTFTTVATLALLPSFGTASNEVAAQEGDFCNVTSKDFLKLDFLSEYTVAGSAGCTLGDKTQCYCAPVLSNNESLSDWEWQCGGKVAFGPAPGKTCPDKVPVPNPNGVSNETSTNVVESQLGVGAYCNKTIHPSGHAGDESCSYSECETGGDHSAICACVDLEDRGVEGGGQQWFCLHSKCDCPVVTTSTNPPPPMSTSTGVGMTSTLVFAVNLLVSLIVAAVALK